ncbi:aromatic acid exporter family protein [Allokutzneria albata]|uniref:hypothetical protein n=1 Tax=Allokutzneria albata TaxID=211114 RepID=UPI0004C38D4E|nr:hypothetical protein [Allokutzneria albata]
MENTQNEPRPDPPASVTAAVCSWTVLGGLMVVLGFLQLPVFIWTIALSAVALAVVLGAVKLRAGFRGPRYGLSLVAVAMALTAMSSFTYPDRDPVNAALVLLVAVGGAVATVLLWLPATNRYLRDVRRSR